MDVDGNTPRCTVVEILAAGATHTSANCGVLCAARQNQFLLPLIVTGGTDAIPFALGSDADAAAAAGRDPLTPNRNFLLAVQCL